MKKPKLHETTPLWLPELPPEVWCIIMQQITNRGNPWLAGRLKALCLMSKTCHHAGYQARLLMLELRHNFSRIIYLGCNKKACFFSYALENNLGAYAFLQRIYYRRPSADEMYDIWETKTILKRTVEVQLIELEYALRRCGKAMAMKKAFDRDVLGYSPRIQGHVGYWGFYKGIYYPKSELFIKSGISQACTPRFSVTFTLAETETTNIAEAAKWFSWTMASFASYHALEVKLVARRGFGSKASAVIKWDAWDRKATLAFVGLVTKLKPPTWPNADTSFQFEAVVYLRQDNTSPDFFGITVHLPSNGNIRTEFFGDH